MTSQVIRAVSLTPAVDDQLRLAAFEERRSMSGILRESFLAWDAQRHADKVEAVKQSGRKTP